MASLAVRAGFTSLPFERLGEPPTPALAATFGERAALTRVIADLALALAASAGSLPGRCAPSRRTGANEVGYRSRDERPTRQGEP